METFQVIVIGAGPGGYVAAIRAAQLGMRTALVEKRPTLGGTCLNIGCIPSKALLESSELYYAALNKLAGHGVQCRSVKLDLNQMMARKQKVVKELTDGLPLLMKKNQISVFNGLGKLAGEGRVRIEGSQVHEIEGRTIILALGSRPVELPFLKFDGERIVSSTEALSFDRVPQRLAVIGAGAIGLELGSVWARLGARVSVIELLPRVAPSSDQQISKALQKALEAQGLEFHLGCQVQGARVQDSGLKLEFQDPEGRPQELECDRVLVAIGRRPLSESAGLKDAGIQLDDRGRVQVDDRFQTNLTGVFAIGDLIPGPMLAHKAEEDGIAVAEMLAGHAGHVNYNVVPNVIYTWPELAEVGFTAEAARQRSLPVKEGKYYFRANARAKSMGEQEGLAKVVAHAETDRLLGVHIVGPRASDLIAEAVTVMEFQGSAEDMGRIIHAHPTLAEVLKEAALAVDKRAIHS